MQPPSRRSITQRAVAIAVLPVAVSALGRCATEQQRQRTADVLPSFHALIVADLIEPWAMTFLPDGRLLVTEKRGSLIVVTPDGGGSEAIVGVPKVAYGGHGGLAEVALHPDFAQNGLVYLTWAEAGEGDTRGAAMGRGRLDLTNMRLENLEVLWRQTPKVAQENHYSHRMAFSPDGRYLFVTSGDRWLPQTA